MSVHHLDVVLCPPYCCCCWRSAVVFNVCRVVLCCCLPVYAICLFNCLAGTKQWRPIDFFPSNAFPQKKIMDSHWLSANRQQVNSSSCNILTNFMCTIYAHCSTSALRHGHQHIESLSCKYTRFSDFGCTSFVSWQQLKLLVSHDFALILYLNSPIWIFPCSVCALGAATVLTS